MEKRISYDVFQSTKRIAQACGPIMIKRERVKANIEKLAKEYQDYDMQIKALESGIFKITGFRVEELVQKVMEPGKPTKYLPTDIVSYDASAKEYVIQVGSTQEEELPIMEDSEEPEQENPEPQDIQESLEPEENFILDEETLQEEVEDPIF